MEITERDLEQVIEERDWAEEVIADTHRALGGDGEWTARIPEPNPPHSGNLFVDTPELAAQVFARAERADSELRVLRARVEDLETQLEVMGAVLEGEVGRCKEADERAEKAEAMLFAEPPDHVIEAGRIAAMDAGCDYLHPVEMRAAWTAMLMAWQKPAPEEYGNG